MSAQVHCFVGPTLPASEIRAVLPDAQVHPPIAHGDLLRLKPNAGDTVAIIDGYFYERAPVRHKEILGCMDGGVTVVGCSSIGALRAVELGPFGMHGIGDVYQLYESGTIDADDEVAVLHASSDYDYRCVTEALVNIRATCANAARVSLMNESDADLIVTTAATMPFHRRSWPEITAAITPVVGRARAETLHQRYEEARVDLKRQDARQMLDWLQANTSERQSTPVRPKNVLARTRFVAEWGHWEIDQAKTPHGPICDIHILSIVQALVADYPVRYLRVMLESYLAGPVTVGGQPRLDWGEIDRALGGIGVDAEWAANRNLTRADLTSYVLRKRQISRLLLGEPAIGEVPIADLESAVWKRAEHNGLFRDGYVPVELERVWLTSDEREGLGLEARGARVIARSHRATGSLPLRTGAIQELKVREDFTELIPAVEYAWSYNEAIRTRDQSHNVDRLSTKAVTEFYLAKWGHEDEPVVAMTERGFTDAEDVSRRGGPFMLAARFGGLELGKQ
jgi:hypothetical protein